ncbi:YigZ family protein [bacterium]|nr:YigZ family protein [bacterium]
MDTEFTLGKTGESAIEIKHSKFYGFAYPVTNRNEVDKTKSALEKDFSDATHIVYAFRLGSGGVYEYFTDSGEPSGTAGAPIIKILQGRNLIDTLVLVVRYFGGTKLGTGGLARAYGNTAGLAIENAGIIPYIKMVRIKVKIPYGTISQFAILTDNLGGIILKQKFEQDISIEAKIPEDNIDELNEFVANITRGKSKIEIIE